MYHQSRNAKRSNTKHRNGYCYIHFPRINPSKLTHFYTISISPWVFGYRHPYSRQLWH